MAALTDKCWQCCCDNWALWGIVLALVFIAVLGNSLSFWLGVAVGLAIPYYIIPRYFN